MKKIGSMRRSYRGIDGRHIFLTKEILDTENYNHVWPTAEKEIAKKVLKKKSREK